MLGSMSPNRHMSARDVDNYWPSYTVRNPFFGNSCCFQWFLCFKLDKRFSGKKQYLFFVQVTIVSQPQI